MSNKNKILVFTATYNEKDNIVELIYSITQNCSDADILIIDDNSPDIIFFIICCCKYKYFILI